MRAPRPVSIPVFGQAGVDVVGPTVVGGGALGVDRAAGGRLRAGTSGSSKLSLLSGTSARMRFH